MEVGNEVKKVKNPWCRGRRYEVGKKRIRGLKAWVGGSTILAERAKWARLNSGGIQAGGVRGGSHGAGRCGISRGSRDAAMRAGSRTEPPRLGGC